MPGQSAYFCLVHSHPKGELSDIPPARDKGQATAVKRGQIKPSVFVLGRSFIGHSRLGSAETNAVYRLIQKGNPKNTADAIIGATAFIDADILVTNDGPFRKKFEKVQSRTKVMSSAEFFDYLGEHKPLTGKQSRSRDRTAKR
jgi:hypothetical protein